MTTPAPTPAPTTAPKPTPVLMTDAQKAELTFINAQTSMALQLAAAPNGVASSIGTTMLTMLSRHFAAAFPEAETERQAYISRVALASTARRGNAAWKQLHTHVLGLPAEAAKAMGTNVHAGAAVVPVPGVETLWLNAWSAGIPCGECKAFYRGYVEKNPPDYTSIASYFAWSVNLHNAVNAKLGKPQISVEQAQVIWSAGAAGK